jgi:hypothetical protein
MSEARKEQVKVIIRKDGTMKVEGKGFVGDACTAGLSKLLGAGTVTDDEKKPEFYQQNEDHVTVGS